MSKVAAESPYDLADGQKIKVGNRTYTIEVRDEVRDGTCEGLCKPGKQTIYISRGVSIEAFREVILHEVLHAIWYGQSIDYGFKTPDTEEYLIGVIAANLAGVIQDNEWLKKIFWD